MSSLIQDAGGEFRRFAPRMREQQLLQRLVGCLATNEGVQPKRTEIWQRLKSLTPREVDVLCYVLGGQRNRDRCGIRYYRKNDQTSSRACHGKARRAINCSIIPNGVALHSLARLAEIQTPPQEAQKARAGESVGFAPERIRRFRSGIWAMDAALVAEKKDDFGSALQNRIGSWSERKI
jgi:hypothetical protein